MKNDKEPDEEEEEEEEEKEKEEEEEEEEEEKEKEEEEEEEEEWQSIKNLINYEAHVFFNVEYAFKLQLNIRDKAFLDVKTDDSSLWHFNDTLE